MISCLHKEYDFDHSQGILVEQSYQVKRGFGQTREGLSSSVAEGLVEGARTSHVLELNLNFKVVEVR